MISRQMVYKLANRFKAHRLEGLYRRKPNIIKKYENEDIKAAVDYMMGSGEGKPSAPSTTAPTAKKKKPLTLTQGKAIYEKSCSVCHNSGFNGAPKLGDKKAWKPIEDAGFLQAYARTMEGYNNHPPKGACATCDESEVKATLKYMMQQGSSENKSYSLW